MLSGMFKLNFSDVLSACVTAILIAVLSYFLSVGDLWKLSFHAVVNIAAIAFATSLLKSFATDSSGNFLGALPIK